MRYFSSSAIAPTIIDREIERQGIKRRIALQIPNFLGAAFVAENTDLIVTIHSRLGALIAGRGSIKTLPVPFPLPDYDVKQHWHERFHHAEGSSYHTSGYQSPALGTLYIVKPLM